MIIILFNPRCEISSNGFGYISYARLYFPEWVSNNLTLVEYRTIPVQLLNCPLPITGWSVDISKESCKTDITGFDLSGARQVNNPISFTVNAQNECSDTLYYRFSVHPEYGTDWYDGLHWTNMADTEWISANTIDYTFTETGKYIVVVWVTDDSTNVESEGIPIIGWSVDIE